jgi:hypothetical protein
MAIAVATTRQNLADRYGTLGNYIGLATANEVTGGTPAYARKATTWSSATGGVINGSAVTIDVPTGTVTHIINASAVSGANMIDAADVTDVVMSAQGQVVVTPSFTIT